MRQSCARCVPGAAQPWPTGILRTRWCPTGSARPAPDNGCVPGRITPCCLPNGPFFCLRSRPLSRRSAAFRSSWTADGPSAAGERIVFATIADRPRGTDGDTRPPWWAPSRPWRASGFRGGGASGWNSPAPFKAGEIGLNSACPHHDNIDVWIAPDPPELRVTLGYTLYAVPLGLVPPMVLFPVVCLRNPCQQD
jgi:hypothetical protein